MTAAQWNKATHELRTKLAAGQITRQQYNQAMDKLYNQLYQDAKKAK